MKTNKVTVSRTALTSLAVGSLILTAGCSGGVVADGGSSDGETVILEFGSFLPESHPYSQWYLAWAEEVTEATDGRVTFENYFAGSLFNGPDLTSAVMDGQVDLAQPNTNYTPEIFPLSELVSVPYSTPDVAAAVSGLTELYETYEPYREEFAGNGLIPLQFQPTGTNVLGSNMPLPDAAAIDGTRVRSASYFATAMKSIGGNPISMPLSDVYQSMQTGLLDAWMTPMENTIQYNLGEVTTHIQDPGMGPTSLSAILMNQKSFESLTDEDQDAVLRISADYNERFVDLLNEIDQETCEVLADTDITLQVWSEADAEATKAEIGGPMLEQYIADAAAVGVDANEFAELWQQNQEEYDGSHGEYPGSVKTCLAQ